MSDDVFFVKKDDRRNPLIVTCTDSLGVVDLTSAASVRFVMRPVLGGEVKIDAAATLEDAAAGKVRYDWADGDTDTADHFDAEFEVMFPDDEPLTFPNDGYVRVVVVADLD